MREIYGGLTRPERFLKNTKRSPNGCLLWTGRLDRGYGKFGIDSCRADRYAYETWVGPIPEGMQIDHLCGVRNCVEPTHLEAVTCHENLHRSGNTWATINSAKTHCKHGHEFTPENTSIQVRNGKEERGCKQCSTERWQRFREAQA